MKKPTTLLSALSIPASAAIIALAASCSEKCGDNFLHNPKTHFCYENRVIRERCGGSGYDIKAQFCAGDSIVDKCGGKVYNPERQFCAGDSIVGKCGGKGYNPQWEACVGDSIVDRFFVRRCGRKAYLPDRQFCDSRDQKVYGYVTIGDQAWMAENLEYRFSPGEYWYYETNIYAYKREKDGLLYDWNAAIRACPSGWHLPSMEEWAVLVEEAKGQALAGKALKSKIGWDSISGTSGSGTDSYGFSALPGGRRDPKGGFLHAGSHAYFWSGTEESGRAHSMRMLYDSDDASDYAADTGSAFSVRCVQNDSRWVASDMDAGSDSAKAAACRRGDCFTDSRNGRRYRTVKIGGKTWMAENLNIKAGTSWCYDNDARCERYGRLYTWETAKGVCPSGWHLSDNDDWQDLANAAHGKDVAGRFLKSKTDWIGGGNGSDDFGFSALPGGLRDSIGDFDRIGQDGYFWRADYDEYDDSSALYEYMKSDKDLVGYGAFGKSWGLSVRCVLGPAQKAKNVVPYAPQPPATPITTSARRRADLQRTITAGTAHLRKAFNERLRDKPGLSGKVTVKFTINEYGKVTSANITESTVDDPTLEGIVIKWVRGLTFEHADSQGDVMEVIYPFMFSP